jgi:glycosyltransferase involved in cell wall biosynthesis
MPPPRGQGEQFVARSFELAKFRKRLYSRELMEPAHILVYEPRVEGHHLVWLRFVVEDFLSAGLRLTLMADTRKNSFERVQKRLGNLLEQVSVFPALEANGKKIGGDGAEAMAECLKHSGADTVFLNTLDEIASPLLRRAAFGRMPPPVLRGRIGGIYIRPRFLAGHGCSLNEWLKATGFARLMKAEWFGPLLLLDLEIQEQCQSQFPSSRTFALPDPCPDNFKADETTARAAFEIPGGRKVFLFYGGAYRRKGLHLATKAFADLPPQSPAFLLCAGQQPDDVAVRAELDQLVRNGRARVISRYIFEEEEKQLFAASDFVLLPYIKHFGNSAVLSRAAAAGKPVITSDEQLVGRLVREHHLGLLFPSGNSTALREAIEKILAAGDADLSRWRIAAEVYAARCSRAVFRRTLINSVLPSVATAANM